MQFKLLDQHDNIVPGTIVYKLGIAQPDTKDAGAVHYLVSLTEGYRGKGDLYVIPATKLQAV